MKKTGSLTAPLLSQDASSDATGTILPFDIDLSIGGEESTHQPRPNNNRYHGKASFATSAFNLANNVAGAGLLTLAAGKAHGQTGWVPSLFICSALAYASSTTFIYIGKACEITGEESFKGLWSYAFGPGTAYIVDSVVFLQCFLSSTIYIGLLGDIFSTILSHAHTSGMMILPSFFTSRIGVIIFLSATVLFPLSLIRDLSALAFTSILGLCAILYTVSFMLYRAVDGSYGIAGDGGIFVDDHLIESPSFDNSSFWNCDIKSLILVSNLGLAFFAHYNAPSYYREMNKPTGDAFPQMVRTTYGILAALYTFTMFAGYATFGDACRGNILLNYNPKDSLAFLGRVATGFSVIFGFPLVSRGVREGLKNTSAALGYIAISNPNNNVKLMASLIVCEALLAILVHDIKIIAGFSGALMGSFLVFICPSVIYVRVLRRFYGIDSHKYKDSRKALIFAPFGLCIAVMGVVINYQHLE